MSAIECKGRDAATGELVRIEGHEVIEYVNPLLDSPPRDPAESEDVWLAPGFVDLQVNGFAGADYNAPDCPAEAIARSLQALFSTGVTRLFPTVITGPPEAMLGALRNLARARESLPEGAAMEAFHVEGPHISSDDGPRGAHPARWVRPPDLEEFKCWQDAAQGNVRLVTLAPEWPGATSYIEALTGQGVVAAIGHTQATAAQIRDAVSAGATLSTHLGNGAGARLPKTDNCIWAQLDQDRLAASFVADGHHLPDPFLRVALRAKGVERCVLVTDAVAPAMCAPGPYTLGEIEVELREDQRVVLRGGDRLAGSSLRMDRAIGNVMRIAGLKLVEAIPMATSNPARIARIAGRLRGLRPGERADVVRFTIEDGSLRVHETWLGGRQVFKGSEHAEIGS
jgi:N-acetylglucosamine-6-phosphate deacetylase